MSRWAGADLRTRPTRRGAGGDGQVLPARGPAPGRDADLAHPGPLRPGPRRPAEPDPGGRDRRRRWRPPGRSDRHDPRRLDARSAGCGARRTRQRPSGPESPASVRRDRAQWDAGHEGAVAIDQPRPRSTRWPQPGPGGRECGRYAAAAAAGRRAVADVPNGSRRPLPFVVGPRVRTSHVDGHAAGGAGGRVGPRGGSKRANRVRTRAATQGRLRPQPTLAGPCRAILRPVSPSGRTTSRSRPIPGIPLHGERAPRCGATRTCVERAPR